jgi:hypothetical protein
MARTNRLSLAAFTLPLGAPPRLVFGESVGGVSAETFAEGIAHDPPARLVFFGLSIISGP